MTCHRLYPALEFCLVASIEGVAGTKMSGSTQNLVEGDQRSRRWWYIFSFLKVVFVAVLCQRAVE